MSVTNGQVANQDTFNDAFLSRTTDSDTTAVIGLASALPASGTGITNIQREHNAIASFCGAALNGIKTLKPTWASNIVGLITDSLQARIEALVDLFDGSTGHTHTGVDGDGAVILAENISEVPLRAFYNRGINMTAVTGTSKNVSALFTVAKTATTSDTTPGVYCGPISANEVLLKTGTDTYGGNIYSTTGKRVFGRITEAAGVFTVSFFTETAGVETAYNFTASTTIAWYYPELYNPLDEPPVHDTFPFFGMDDRPASGGGGGSLAWIEDSDSPISITENHDQAYVFEDALTQQLYALVKVPSTYVAGNAIKLRTTFYSAITSGTALILAQATLIRTGTDAMTSTTNQRTTTNTAVTLSGGTASIPQSVILDISTSTGTINSVAVAAGDLIRVRLYRDTATDTAAGDVKVPVYGAEVTFQ